MKYINKYLMFCLLLLICVLSVESGYRNRNRNHPYYKLKLHGVRLGRRICGHRFVGRRCDSNKFGDIYQYVPNNLAEKITEAFLVLLKKTFGFLSPPDTARALSILQTALYNVLSVYHADFDPAHAECKFLKRIKRCQNGEKIKISLLIVSKNIGRFLFKSKPMELNGYIQSINQLLQNYNVANNRDAKMVGRMVGRCIRRRYRNDGSNQLGNHPESKTGAPYSDYTNYSPINPPQTISGKTTCSAVKDLNHWQQLKVPVAGGGTTIRSFLSPHYGLVKPFALKNGYEVFPPAPPSLSSADPTIVQKQRNEAAEVLQISGSLDDRKKVIAEYWADGPDSTLPPGHWTDLALKMAEKKKLSLLETVLLLFLQTNAQFDAGISTWAAKRYYDFVRPITQLQCLYAGQQVTAWKGPYQGVGTINGSDWQPYQNKFFVTPPFAEYTSGHSAFSTASAEAMKLFFNSDVMGLSFTIKEGESVFEPKIMAGSPGYVSGVTDVANTGPNTVGYVPACDITLSWATFTEASDESGISRLYGGIHFESGNVEGKKVGRKVGKIVWKKYLKLINKDRSRRCSRRKYRWFHHPRLRF